MDLLYLVWTLNRFIYPFLILSWEMSKDRSLFYRANHLTVSLQKKTLTHVLLICNSQAYRKMCLAKMNYVCTSCSLRDSLVSISGMLWKRPLNVADPHCMFCLRVCHWATMERMSAGQSLTRLPTESKDQSWPIGLTPSVFPSADPDNWDSWPLWSQPTSNGR